MTEKKYYDITVAGEPDFGGAEIQVICSKCKKVINELNSQFFTLGELIDIANVHIKEHYTNGIV